MTLQSIVVLRPRTPLTGFHDNLPRLILEGEHCRVGVPVELVVNPLNELRRCRRRQRSLKKHLVDFRLDSNMRCRFNLKIAPILILVQIARQSALNVSGACVVALDEIAVIRIHDAHRISQIPKL